tara:strand:- start:1643 stop:3994 length:2352 start_codon:yes stop_codon:yes gene_type:complete
MCEQEATKQYLEAGLVLTTMKLRGDTRTPAKEGWQDIKIKETVLLCYEGNLGMVIKSNQLVVDVDPRHGGDESIVKLADDLGVDFGDPTVLTPRGGEHYYMNLSGDDVGSKFNVHLKDYPGIDFLTLGKYVLTAGSFAHEKHYRWFDDDKDFGGLTVQEAPEELLELLRKKVKKGVSEGEGLGDFEGLINGSSHTAEEVVELLDKIDNDIPNDEWVKVGMALKWWHPVDGLALWEEWSVGGETYKEGECEKRWRSFEGEGGDVTIGTIIHMAREGAYVETRKLVDRVLSKVAAADEEELVLNLAPRIKKREMSVLDRNKIAVAIQGRLTVLSGGVKPPIGVCRDMIAGGEVVRMEEGEVPEWCENWVYVNSHTAYVHTEKLKVLKTAAFNLENGRWLAGDHNGRKPTASAFVADHGLVEPVDTMNYLPMIDEKIVKLGARTVLNTFDKKGVPEGWEGEFTDEGLAAIELIKAHLVFLCGGKKDAKVLLQWLAHQVQWPGRQILWSPVIQSIPGAGKSFFATMLRMCLGVDNVGVVKPDQVSSQFNGWAQGVCVNVLEELMVQGHNRFEALNAVKPLITDEIVQINEKGVAPYMCVNVSNYICFTNFKNALPLDGVDRRWWVIFAAIEKLEDMEELVGVSADVYFPRLFDAVRKCGSEVRKWMLEYEISAEFLNMKTAPMTGHKGLMIATEEAGVEGYMEVKELIRGGGEYFTEGCVSSVDMFDALTFEHENLELNTLKRNTVMKKLGYLQMPELVKIDGKPRRVWVKKVMTNSEVREILKKKG